MLYFSPRHSTSSAAILVFVGKPKVEVLWVLATESSGHLPK